MLACLEVSRPTQKLPGNPHLEISFSLVTPTLWSCHIRLDPILIASGLAITNVAGSWLYVFHSFCPSDGILSTYELT